jgi:hypothetical protein
MVFTRLILRGIVASVQFVQYCYAGHEKVFVAVVVPPLAGPLLTREHFGLSARLVVKTRYGCLYVDSRLHLVGNYIPLAVYWPNA